MSIKTILQNQKKLQLTPMKNALKLLGWVIFSIVAINLIVRLFEIYVSKNGLDSFFYLLIFIFSIGSIFIIYPKINKMFQKDQTGDMEKYLKNTNIVIGYLVNDEKDEKQDRFLDLDDIMNRKNLKNDKKYEKEEKKAWLEEERKLFRV